MSIFGRLFGSEKIIETAVKGVDKIIFTKEEQAENFKETLKLYEPFKVAQRYLAVIFCLPYVAAWFVTFAASFTDISLEKQIDILQGDMGTAVLAIVSFYFLGGAMSGVLGAKKR